MCRPDILTLLGYALTIGSSAALAAPWLGLFRLALLPTGFPNSPTPCLISAMPARLIFICVSAFLSSPPLNPNHTEVDIEIIEQFVRGVVLRASHSHST
jgi:hypothetical protein